MVPLSGRDFHHRSAPLADRLEDLHGSQTAEVVGGDVEPGVTPAMTLGVLRMAEDEFLTAMKTEGGINREEDGDDAS